MKIFFTISFSFCFAFFIGCNLESKDSFKNEPLIGNLNGEWEKIEVNGNNEVFYNPIGIGFSDDSIEFLHGMYKSYLDTNIGKKRLKYFGNSTTYKISNDSILYKNPPNLSWKFWNSIIDIKQDTLSVLGSDSIIDKYKKLHYNLDKLIEFDQIVLSRNGCYGTCPKLKISLNRNGVLNFIGIRYTDSLGLYKGQLSKSLTQQIFRKFQKAYVTDLEDSYYADHTDDETIYTTYIKDDSIIKTIEDYGRTGPAELVWAYVLLSNSYTLIPLKKSTQFDPSYTNFENYRSGELLVDAPENTQSSIKHDNHTQIWDTIRMGKEFLIIHNLDSNEIEIIKSENEDNFYTALDDLMWYTNVLTDKLDSLKKPIIYTTSDFIKVFVNNLEYQIIDTSTVTYQTIYEFDNDSLKKVELFDLLDKYKASL